MRLFLAIELPASVKTQIEKQLIPLVSAYPDCRWVSPENYHVTVYFFGEVSDLQKITPRLDKVIFDAPQFYLYSQKLDLFMHEKITVYLDFLREKKLEKIARNIEQEFGTFSTDRKYVAHMTLARCRIPSKQQYFVFKKRLSKVEVDVTFPVRRLTLFNSILSGPKPIYQKIASYKLLP